MRSLEVIKGQIQGFTISATAVTSTVLKIEENIRDKK